MEISNDPSTRPALSSPSSISVASTASSGSTAFSAASVSSTPSAFTNLKQKQTSKASSISSANSTSSTSKPHPSNGNGGAQQHQQQEPPRQPRFASAFTASSSYHGHDKSEVTRLILQALNDLGHTDVANLLEEKSGLSTELPVVASFREAILSGSWDQAEELLGSLQIRPNTDVKYLSFLIRRQQFLELLESKDKENALVILRTKIATLPTENPPKSTADSTLHYHLSPEEIEQRRSQIRQLSNLVMFSPEDIAKTLSWDGAWAQSRRYLLGSLQELISPDMMIPRHRLAKLLTQAKEFQLSRANYRTNDTPFSLIIDYPDDKSQFPTRTAHILTEHKDEVWFINFSHNAKFLASASKDNTVIIWRVADWSVQTRLTGHTRGVLCVEWSPDDKMILTSSEDHRAMLFDPMSGKKLQEMAAHSDVVSSCAWLPSSQHFITASPDMKMILWDITGKQVDFWGGTRVLSMAVTPNGKLLIAIGHDESITFYNLVARVRVVRVEAGHMLSITVSKDSRYALVNLTTDEIHLWDLETLRIVRKYYGQPEKIVKNCLGQLEKFVLRSCFGGPEENLVLCGSEDGNIYAWNRETTNLVEIIRGHTNNVNCVRFNPLIHDMLASSSDDGTIRIWRP